MILLFEAILLALLFLMVANNQSQQNRENAKFKKTINAILARQEHLIEETGLEQELSYYRIGKLD